MSDIKLLQSTVNPKIYYTPEISGKVVCEIINPNVNHIKEYGVFYGTVSSCCGQPLQTYDTLTQATKGLVMFSGYGKPKQPFQPTSIKLQKANQRKHALNTVTFSSINMNSSVDITDLETKLRKNWKI